MPKAFWFIFGFLFALVLGALLVVLPMAGIRAGIGRTPALPDAATVAGATVAGAPETAAPETAAPETTAPVDTTPAPAPEGLLWVREGGLQPPLGACSQLLIDTAWQIRYGPCHEGLRLAYLTENELAWYQAYVFTLEPFDYTEQAGEGARASVTLAFQGQGARQANLQEQDHLAVWVEQLYTRVMGQEQRANMLAQARSDLMARERVGIESIQMLEIEPVRWPDACLGLRQERLDCARVVTQGYRIVMAVDGRTYEYRADAYGQVKSVRGYAPHLILAPLVP